MPNIWIDVSLFILFYLEKVFDFNISSTKRHIQRVGFSSGNLQTHICCHDFSPHIKKPQLIKE